MPRLTRASANDFVSEQQLVSIFRKHFGSNGPNKWVWLSEFDFGNGVADLTAVKPVMGPSTEWLGKLPARWAYAAAAMPVDSEMSLDDFASFVNLTSPSALSVLRSFERAGICSKNVPARTWTKSEQIRPIAKEIVAVEAKLTDWKRALYQASRYTSFASEAWVVMSSIAYPRASNHIEEFTTRGIGLAFMDPDGQHDVLNRPRKATPRSPLRFWEANGKIARRLATNSTTVESI